MRLPDMQAWHRAAGVPTVCQGLQITVLVTHYLACAAECISIVCVHKYLLLYNSLLGKCFVLLDIAFGTSLEKLQTRRVSGQSGLLFNVIHSMWHMLHASDRCMAAQCTTITIRSCIGLCHHLILLQQILKPMHVAELSQNLGHLCLDLVPQVMQLLQSSMQLLSAGSVSTLGAESAWYTATSNTDPEDACAGRRQLGHHHHHIL